MEQIYTCSPWKGPHARAGGCLKEAVTPWGACAGAGSCQDLWPVERGVHTRAGLLAGLATPWGPKLEQPVPEGRHPVEGTHAGTVHEELQPIGRTHGELSPVKGTPRWSRGRE